MNIALILAGGIGERMNVDTPKSYLRLGEKSLIRRTIEIFKNHPLIDNVCVVIHKKDTDLYNETVKDLDLLPPVFGGDERSISSRLGLEGISEFSPKKVLIHDACRPFVDSDLITRIIEQLNSTNAVVPAIPINDTVKKVKDSTILWTVDRTDLWKSQTPQGFIFEDILQYHQLYKDKKFSDDAALHEYAGSEVLIIPGSENNFKISNQADYNKALTRSNMNKNKMKEINYRIGHGCDLHVFQKAKDPENCFICIGGVKVKHNMEIKAHSDGDVLLHAIVDSILGAIGENDIGYFFPPTDPKWKDVNSETFIKEAMNKLKEKGGSIVNIDLNIITEKPKIFPVRDEIRKKVAFLLDLDVSRVNIKAKTNEKVDAIGRQEAIGANATVLIILD